MPRVGLVPTIEHVTLRIGVASLASMTNTIVCTDMLDTHHWTLASTITASIAMAFLPLSHWRGALSTLPICYRRYPDPEGEHNTR